MTDAKTAHIDLELTDVPAGSPVCGVCRLKESFYSCSAFPCGLLKECPVVRDTCRHPSCLAAEQRITPDPPMEPGWYKVRSRHSKSWFIVEIMKVGETLLIFMPGTAKNPSFDIFDIWSGPLAMPGGA